MPTKLTPIRDTVAIEEPSLELLRDTFLMIVMRRLPEWSTMPLFRVGEPVVPLQRAGRHLGSFCYQLDFAPMWEAPLRSIQHAVEKVPLAHWVGN